MPDASELHNAQVEPICRKYLELRYRMMPYLYSAVRECTETGMPMMRALWLHYPDDPKAAACGDQYLWGRNLLVAPVVEPGAASAPHLSAARRLVRFLDRRALAGGREISRAVDLETLPLYVSAGSILPLGPIAELLDGRSAKPNFSRSLAGQLHRHPGRHRRRLRPRHWLERTAFGHVLARSVCRGSGGRRSPLAIAVGGGHGELFVQEFDREGEATASSPI